MRMRQSTNSEPTPRHAAWLLLLGVLTVIADRSVCRIGYAGWTAAENVGHGKWWRMAVRSIA